jgi:D-alanyl-lipoteichoic acid acyltransferase DltB (MBOAT superfamily)
MLFFTASYFLFFLVTLTCFYLFPVKFRKPLLLAASYFFYMSWNWKFIPLLLILTIIDFVAAIWIEDRRGSKRKWALVASLASNLGFLGIFKYYNFAASNLALLLGLPPARFYHDIVLPLGISFHTFQSISYVVDVYRGEQKAIRKPLDYALFIAFFPQLVAGPIVRARNFFSDLYAWKAPDMEQIKHGAFLIVLGLAKKVALADNFAQISDRYFSSVGSQPGGAAAWGAVFSFAMQIYFDFSGYTDMAIGFARVLGFHFPVNFRQPYLAVSITDFWRRWHISLSSWLRDYLYVPLGGNRHGKWMTYRNLMLTMLLGGLWHGANWNFMIWGGYHGAILSLERLFGQAKHRDRGWTPGDVPRAILTFVLACIGWVFFRASSVHDAMLVIGRMLQVPRGHWPVEPALMVLAGVSLLAALWEDQWPLLESVRRAPAWAVAGCLGTLLFVAEIFGVDGNIPFVYFQF